MRFPLCVATVCVAFLFAYNSHVDAHGPGGGGRPNFSGSPGAKGDFHSGAFEGKPTGNPAGKDDKTQVSTLHPSSPAGLNHGGGNPALGGSIPPAGKTAIAHKIEEQNLKHKLTEALRMLEQAKQSNDPQLIAKAQQHLQQVEQHIAQQRANGGQGGPGNASATAGMPAQLPARRLVMSSLATATADTPPLMRPAEHQRIAVSNHLEVRFQGGRL